MISITVDCEQWNSPLLRGKKTRENNSTQFSERGNKNLLSLFRKYSIESTFFITSYFAEKEKQQTKEISRNHEVGSHGHCHHYRGNPHLDLDEDVRISKEILERITGKKISGFRAPQLQYSDRLLTLLKKYGFSYDSSLHPAYFPFWIHNRSYPFKIHTRKSITEVPVAVFPRSRLPLSWF